MRYHLDEQVDHAIARGLRARGIDVSTTTDAGLIAAEDDRHVLFAKSEQRIIFTHDADFLRLAQSGVEHDGVVYSAPGAASIGEIIRFLSFMNDCLTMEDMKGKVQYLFPL